MMEGVDLPLPPVGEARLGLAALVGPTVWVSGSGVSENSLRPRCYQRRLPCTTRTDSGNGVVGILRVAAPQGHS